MTAARLEQLLLVVAGFALVLGSVLATPWVAVVTLPAAVIAPGHVLLRWAAARLTADVWLTWTLRVLLSLALWTLLGAVFAIAPGLDPRVLPLLVGPVVAFAGLAGPGRAGRHPVLPRRPADPASAVAPDAAVGALAPGAAGAAGAFPDGDGDGWDPGRAGRPVRRDPRTVVGRLVTVAIFGAVAAGSLAAGYRIIEDGPRAESYVSVALTPADVAPYDSSGRLTGAAVAVRNGTPGALRVSLDLRLDGRRLAPIRLGQVPAGGTARAALDGVRLPACWTRLSITPVGADLRGVSPRGLVVNGPIGDLPGCPAATP